MTFQTLVSAEELLTHLGDPDWAIVDCRFTLGNPERGRRSYQVAHIPGAVYSQLEEDLSLPHVPGVTGRHPLPPVIFLSLPIACSLPVKVCYNDQSWR